MTEFKLSGQLNIPIEEAKNIIDSYFKAFPSIGKFLNTLASFGRKRGYIKTFGPYFRRRYFSNHEIAINLLSSSDYNSNKEGKKIMGQIERQSKNTPIQGTSADMVKRALCLIREYLVDNPELSILLVMTVHDQIDTICHKDIAEEWKLKFNLFMEQAANESLPEKLLKAETNITEVWQK
jgi:DNA polymerase-1